MCRSPLKNETFCQTPSQHSCTIQCLNCAEETHLFFSVDIVYVLEPQLLCNSMRFGSHMQIVTHGNDLWDSISSRSIFLAEVRLANMLIFPVTAFPQVGQWGNAILGQKKARVISPLAQLVRKDVSPSSASPVGNTWIMTCQQPQRCLVLVQLQAEMEICNLYHKDVKAKNTCKNNIPAFFCKRT